VSVASVDFRRNDWTRRLLTTAPLGSRDGRPVSSRESPARCSRVALAASLSPRYDLPDLTINFWHSVFVRAVKKDGPTSRVFWRTYVHIGAESRSRRSPCRLGLRPVRSTFRSSAGPPEPGCFICERTCGHQTECYCIYEAREPSIFSV